MTEPVARAVSPRRTVRVAVALVAGQAVLCAVIGWVTFGPSEPGPPAAGARPATEPVVLPTPSLLLPTLRAVPEPSRKSASTASSVATSPRASRSNRPPPSRATSQPAAEKERPVMAVDETPPAPPLSPDPDVAATLPPTAADEVQFPVVEGRRCAPEGAEGRDVDDADLRCVRDDDGDLVWQIN